MTAAKAIDWECVEGGWWSAARNGVPLGGACRERNGKWFFYPAAGDKPKEFKTLTGLKRGVARQSRVMK